MINNTENISFENYDINNENININEEIKLSNKNYFSPSKNKKNIKDNTLIYSPQFGTKKEPKIDNKKEIATLNPSKSARDISKIISIEVDLNNKKSNLHENTPIRNLNNSYSNIKPHPKVSLITSLKSLFSKNFFFLTSIIVVSFCIIFHCSLSIQALKIIKIIQKNN